MIRRLPRLCLTSAPDHDDLMALRPRCTFDFDFGFGSGLPEVLAVLDTATPARARIRREPG
jgi:hypothetical protein